MPTERRDLAAIAREQVAQTRQTLGLSVEDFASVLGETLAWQPTAGEIISWETSSVPPGDIILALPILTGRPRPGGVDGDQLGDLVAVYRSRSQFSTHMPPDQLMDGANTVRAVGLSLNLLTQGFADRRWHDLIEGGAQVRCLFLDPAGSAIQVREAEEGFPAGQLSGLTKLNIETLMRVRDRLPDDLRNRMELAVYDDTLRFNVVLVDDVCIAQPYLTESRRVDSPAFVIRRRQHRTCLYPVFDQFFETQWGRGRKL
ncbi:hypothetical protein C1I99_21755 [Micromonospora deserti]|uniref:DUF5919 domain-containing protein n=2 Tax=Micromonospora deserti TaxID=2070366 RepID=A0A2W2BYW4_9ACTN|nr:hypothetical protein C1I99_21755 [Micromonospora deserti]